MRSQRPEGPQRSSFWGGVAAGLVLPLLGLWLWAGPVLASALHPPARSGQSEEAALITPAPPTRILILGVDERKGDSGRSDTMLLLQIDAGSPLRILSIPRDTKVTLKDHGESKINSAYTYGGPDLAREAVATLTGLTVDYYVKINLAGFRHLVDLLGGIEFNVPKRMHYVDPTDGLLIDLQPGLQHLDGTKAEQLVRFRHDEVGDDVGRIGRQQEFLKALVAEALTPSKLPELPGLVMSARQYVETDLPVAAQFKLAQAVYGARSSGGLVVETLPGHGGYEDGISFYLPDRSQLQRLAKLWQYGVTQDHP